ncbi:RluA family pseudouridine synthase [Brevibacillus nitrificans]|uniref:Pseudouridine synthase n=1 Tax=Brevibacillus nitrificans TaxID=651560 RepID=A0A3M8DMX1_9BACL|nr:RluA family pseudouridine synthase [Brevibacillus nitrificans]RNB88919.1 RluA family pseudouridine synthase [Brevibacillus nitrificans]
MQTMKKEGEWLIARLTAADAAATPIGNLLREGWKLPRKQVHLLFQHKEVLIDGQPVAQHAKVEEGQEIRLRLCQPEPFGIEPVEEPLDVLYEDDHLLIVEKQAGILLHPTEPHHHLTLDHLVAGHFFRTGQQAKVRHVHRLDQDTSGVVLYAKHPWASAILDEMLRERLIKRTYVAFVHGQVAKESGKINQPIGKDRNHATRRRVTPNGDTAITHYTVREKYRNATKVECSLETGRTHQIRVHLSYIGHPLIGDTLYGGKRDGILRQALHAEVLQFTHPFGNETVKVHADLPADLVELEKRLR